MAVCVATIAGAMLTRVVEFSVRRPGLVIGLACALLMYGIVVASRTRYDVFPEFAPPQVEIQTEAPGLDPEQVEVLVTTPIEQAITGTAGVAIVRSQSIQGLSVIDVIFRDATDIYQARQLVSERIGEVARRLPQTAEAPIIAPLTSSTGTALVVGLTSSARSLRDIRTFADWTLRPRLLAVPGVGSVTIFGGDVRQLQIHPDLARLRAAGLGLADLVRGRAGATGDPRRGRARQRQRADRDRARGPARRRQPNFAASPIRARGRRRPADRRRRPRCRRFGAGDRRRRGRRHRRRHSSRSTRSWAPISGTWRRRPTARSPPCAPAFRSEEITLHANVFRPAHFIDLALGNVTHSLLHRGRARRRAFFSFFCSMHGAAAVSLTAIPMSLLTALVVMSAMGYSINTLTLGGLAVALGEVVDDAIIDVENIARRLRENRARGDATSRGGGRDRRVMEVRSSVVYATFVVVLVFAPVVTLTGVHGALFRPLGLAYACAILASLVVALTLTPR